MTEDLPYGPYRATVKFRRSERYQVRPKAEAIDGRTLIFTRGWVIAADESDIYAGETAWLPYGSIEGVGWIAGGDLIDMEPAPHE